MWVYILFFSRFHLKPLWKFYNDNFCEHFAFYSCSNWHLFLHFGEANLAATYEKVNLWEAASPSWLQQLSFSFIPSCGRWRGPGHGLSARAGWCQRVKLESWSPATGPELGPAKSAHGEMMRWGGGGKQNTACSHQPTPCIRFSAHHLKSRPKTRFKPSLLVQENAKFHVLNLANVHRKLLSI